MHKIDKELEAQADVKIAKVQMGFFKTGKGQYGEGDVFIGLTAKAIANIAKKHYSALGLAELEDMLRSKVHEKRAVALKVLVEKYRHYAKSKDKRACEDLFSFYLKNTKWINNWDLVDMSAPYIIGMHLLDRKDRSVLYRLARSDSLWERRIAIVATWILIRNGQFSDTLSLSELLLGDNQDLMHKAVGWMLREVGKRDQTLMTKFIRMHYSHISRTTLRYAIERLPEAERKDYLKGEFKQY